MRLRELQHEARGADARGQPHAVREQVRELRRHRGHLLLALVRVRVRVRVMVRVRIRARVRVRGSLMYRLIKPSYLALTSPSLSPSYPLTGTAVNYDTQNRERRW